MARIKAVLIDLSGTIHIGKSETPGSVKALLKLRQSGVRPLFCSNTTKESKSDLLKKLRAIGFALEDSELFTSLSACRALIDTLSLKPLYLLSPSALQDFPAVDCEDAERNAVVIGLAPESFSYGTLDRAFRILKGEYLSESARQDYKPRLIAAHAGMYYASDKEPGGKLSLGPGPFVHALELASGVKAEVVGKPEKKFFESVLESFGEKFAPGEVAMIGDDVKGDCGSVLRELGLRRYLVKTGKYRAGDEDKIEDKADFKLLPDFAAVVEDIIGES